MPLFLAKKRKAPAGFTNQGDSTFVRSEPSRFRYVVFSLLSTAMLSFLQYFGTAATAIWYHVKQDVHSSIDGADIPSTFVTLKKSDCLPFRNPTGTVSLPASYRLPSAVQALFQKYNALSPIKIFRGKSQYQVNELHGIIDEDIPQFLELSAHTVKTFTAVAKTLSPGGYRAYLEILNITSAAVGTMWYGINTQGSHPGKCRLDGIIHRTSGGAIKYGSVAYVNERVVYEKEDKDREVTAYRDNGNTPPTFVTRDASEAMQPWGSIADYAQITTGLTLPFRSDYTSPDIGILSQFARSFPGLFDKNSIDDDADDAPDYISWLESWWVDEIASTDQGMWMAHLMKSMVIGKECGCSVWACVANGVYLGAVLGGGSWKLSVDGEVYEPLAAEPFKKDLETIDVHTKVLNDILDILKMPSPRALPASMRRLRDIVMASTISGEEKNRISELLPRLIFTQEPVGCNLTTMKSTIAALTDPNSPISIDDYLPASEFFSVDPYRLILARFGRRAPSFNTGQVLTRFSSNAKGAGIMKATDFKASPPVIFQVEFVALGGAVASFRKLMSTGLQSINGTVELTGAHMVFRGKAAGELWAFMSSKVYEELDKTIPQGGTGSGDGKRKEDFGNDGQDNGSIPQQPKKKKFSMFGKS